MLYPDRRTGNDMKMDGILGGQLRVPIQFKRLCRSVSASAVFIAALLARVPRIVPSGHVLNGATKISVVGEVIEL
jgi:hypothetical protein